MNESVPQGELCLKHGECFGGQCAYAGLTLPAVVQADLTQLDALAKVYASSYASPHHITFTVEGLRNLIASLDHSAAPGSPSASRAPFSEPRSIEQGELPVRAEMEKDAARYQWLRGRVPGGAYRIMGVIYSEGGAGVDAAIDAAMSAPGGGGAAA